jgi:hypothetical protein
MSTSSQHWPAAGQPRLPAAVHVTDLVVSEALGQLLLGPVSLHLAAGDLAVITGADPAGRWLLACALTGRLPLDRMRQTGRVTVAGRSTPPLIRAVSVLADSWRLPGIACPVDRRLAALNWARQSEAGLVALSSGLDGLTPNEQSMVLHGAAELAAGGRTVVVTSPLATTGLPGNELVSATIALPGRTPLAA